MKTIDRERIQDTIVALLRLSYRNESDALRLWSAVETLSEVAGGLPQAALARRIGRSRPTIACLLRAGALRRDERGAIAALDAALVELALGDRGKGRGVLQRVAEVADWFNELRDPDFRRSLQELAAGRLAPLERPVVDATEREARKRAFLEAQAAAARTRSHLLDEPSKAPTKASSELSTATGRSSKRISHRIRARERRHMSST